jgi:hypothetical protein
MRAKERKPGKTEANKPNVQAWRVPARHDSRGRPNAHCSAVDHRRRRCRRRRSLVRAACAAAGAVHLPFRSTPLAFTSSSLGRMPSRRAARGEGRGRGVALGVGRTTDHCCMEWVRPGPVVPACCRAWAGSPARRCFCPSPVPSVGVAAPVPPAMARPPPGTARLRTCHSLRCVRERCRAKHEDTKPGRLPRQVVLVAW